MKKEMTIIWDWNGTLLDDVQICIRSMNSMLNDRHLPLLNLDRYREVFTFPVIDYYSAIGFDFNLEPWDVAALEFIRLYLELLPDCGLTPGADTILRYFHSKGYRQAIISAMQHDALVDSVNALGISGYLDYIGGINDHFADGKIENAIHFFQKYDLSAGNITLIGDTLHDAEVAKKLGCNCILVANGHQSKARLTSSGNLVVESLNDIENLFG